MARLQPVDVFFDSKGFENNLLVFSAGLGGFFDELLSKVGDRMTAEARRRAPRRSGALQNSINFSRMMCGGKWGMTTKENWNRNIRYAWGRERGSYIRPKRRPFIRFVTADGWRTIAKHGGQSGITGVRTPASNFMVPVFNKYWRGKNADGYRALAEELNKKMGEELGLD